VEVRSGGYLAYVEREIKTTTRERRVELKSIWCNGWCLLLLACDAVAYVEHQYRSASILGTSIVGWPVSVGR